MRFCEPAHSSVGLMSKVGAGGGLGAEDAAAKRRKLERKLREVVEENNRLKEELGQARYKIKRLKAVHQCASLSLSAVIAAAAHARTRTAASSTMRTAWIR